ncbi:hypothetical protein [Isoptericola sp. NPDC056605]|uniref:hypothetical protein n=1 Tax=Isoptericola sp. NPDC056605 TaxID=3345876 RepID=UPI0036CF677D
MNVTRRPATASVTVGVFVLLAACSPAENNPPADSAASPIPTVTAAPTTEEPSPLSSLEPTEESPEPVVLDCYDDEQGDLYITRDDGTQMQTDLAALWPSEYDLCDTWEAVTPTTGLELAAYDASGYDDNDIGVLYAICAQNDAADDYATADMLTKPQKNEIRAAMMLCPDHPLAGDWAATIKRSSKTEKKVKAEAEDAARAVAVAERYGHVSQYVIDAFEDPEYLAAFEPLVCAGVRDTGSLDERGGLRGLVMDSTSDQAEPAAPGVWQTMRVIQTGCPEREDKFVGMLDAWDEAH